MSDFVLFPFFLFYKFCFLGIKKSLIKRALDHKFFKEYHFHFLHADTVSECYIVFLIKFLIEKIKGMYRNMLEDDDKSKSTEVEGFRLLWRKIDYNGALPSYRKQL